jgi:hypothetical protein
MARIDILELKAEERRLMAELAAIRAFIAAKQGDDIINEQRTLFDGVTDVPKRGRTKPEGIPKAGESWEGYVKVILREIGRPVKASEVIDYAMKANPREPESLVTNAVRGKLSKLSIKGEIRVVDSTLKSEGYVYALNEGDVAERKSITLMN